MERRGVYADATGQGRSKKKYWRTSHKFDIVVPKTLEDSLDVDCKIGTGLLEKDIRKEMKNVKIAFKKLDRLTPKHMQTVKIKPGYSYFSTHMIFDNKIDRYLTVNA